MTKSKLAVLVALALGASGALAAVQPAQTGAMTPAAATLIAKHGADDTLPPGCDDHGTDLCNVATIVAKHGADDAVDGADDNGIDFVLGKNGADDAVDGADDNGVDFITG